MRTPAFKFANTREQKNKQHDDTPTTPEPYCADKKLQRAVNLALALERPLLLEGEAGCGKTRLARALAYELGLPFYAWHVRSTSKAQDGLYTYDAMLRLHDVQIRKADADNAKALPRDPAEPKDYRQLGALGKAFDLKSCPAVVLIDEIDKADIDFPNDLLAVLDDSWSFTIPETNETITAAHKPIVIITSNKEKGNLPAPFLRRCLYFYVEFPGEKELKEIVEEHARLTKKTADSDLTTEAANQFTKLRKEGGLHKKPGTSEFLDWVNALHEFEAKPWQAEQLKQVEMSTLPYPELLFKLRADWQRYGTTE